MNAVSNSKQDTVLLTEQGTIVSIEADRIWVVTKPSTACGQCASGKGCGLSWIHRWLQKPHYIPIILEEQTQAEPLKVGDKVQFGLPPGTLIKGAFLVYISPLFCIIGGIALLPEIIPANSSLFPGETVAILGALLGLIASAILLYKHALKNRFHRGYHPVLIEEISPT